jgi:hypothetical protein
MMDSELREQKNVFFFAGVPPPHPNPHSDLFFLNPHTHTHPPTHTHTHTYPSTTETWCGTGVFVSGSPLDLVHRVFT